MQARRPDEQEDTYACKLCGGEHYQWETCAKPVESTNEVQMTDIEKLQAQIDQSDKILVGMIQAIGKWSTRIDQWSTRIETQGRRINELEQRVDELEQLRRAQWQGKLARERVDAQRG